MRWVPRSLDSFVMGFITAVGLWLALFGVVLFVMLFGESEMFQGTPVEQLHWLITDGLCVGCSWVLKKIVGRAAGERVEAALGEFFDRPNPAMQLVYASLVMGGYWVFCVHAYDLIGGDGEGALSTWHRRAIPVAMLISIASWLATCWSDPGTVDARTLDAHLAAYPFDNVLYSPKLCPTLKVTCPARSKYCRVTRRRVGKFDHFCGWMNNAIGENNLRYFVSFLALHVALTSYGAWLCFAVIRGEISRRGLWGVAFEGPGGAPTTLARDRALLFRFVMYHFSPIVMLGVFLVILAVMLGSFLGYHAWMIAEGVTTNETFKIKDYQRSARRRAAGEGDAGWNRASGERVTVNEMDDDDRHVGCAGATSKAEDASRGESASTTSAREGGALRRRFTFWRRRGPPTPRFVIAYHKGFRTNLLEVFFPPSRAHSRRLDAMAKAGKRGGGDASKKSRSIR